MEQCESAAALLESVREQEVQFEQLTRALEEERRRVGLPATSPSALGRPLPHTQVTLPHHPHPETLYRMVDPAHGALDESYSPEDDSQEVHSVFSEEGTTRRLWHHATPRAGPRRYGQTETQVKNKVCPIISCLFCFSKIRPHMKQCSPSVMCRSCEDTLDGDMGGVDPYAWGVPMTMERGSMASLDSTLRKGPPGSWRQPELPEVIAMLNYRLDPVKTNAAAFLQHLTFKNDKSEVRRLKGIPSLVSLLDHPSKDVHHSACGALKNISYGRDQDNKIAIKNCDGVPALVRLLRKTRDQDLTDTITGTLWNLSSHDSVKMEIVDHALHALADEVIVPHSGWERGSNGGEESCKPRHLEWETALTNTAGCLRNVSSERSEARRKLRECTGLVDSLMYIVQSQINRKDVDNKLVENCVCLLRNLSYQVHREAPGSERYAESAPLNQGPAPANKGGCFGSRKGKDEWFSKGKKDGDDGSGDQVDIPKRTTPAKGYELLYQPEVVRVYTSLLRESKNPSVLEAAAGAIQNLCAGRWTYGRYIRATVRLEKGLPMMAELLAHGNDRVVRAMSGALRNLAIDNRNCELLGLHAVPHLVANLPGGKSQSGRTLSEETVVSVLSTLAEVLGNSLEAAKTLRASQGIERLVLINKDGKRSDREVRGAGQVLQLVWAHKELRRPLEKDGWKKTDFMVNLNPNGSTTNGPSTRANGTYEDSTTPLLDRGEKRDMIPLNDLGPGGYIYHRCFFFFLKLMIDL
uniref:Catenin delta 1 n=1 Tax=Sparus aurata TaxID=8175 RepID=A0A671UWX7_SPAAU